jgi:O-antigen/teichoic acid export membrane protein
MLFFGLVEAEQLGRSQFKKYMYLMLAQRILTLLLVPIFYFMFGVEGALYGFAFSYLVVSYKFYIWTRHARVSISTLRPIRYYFVNSYALGVSKVLPYFSDKLIILPLFGPAIVGYYQYGIQMLTITSMIPVIFYSYILPREATNENNKPAKKMEKLGLISSTLVTVLLVVTMPIITSTFFPQFAITLYSTQLILLAAIPLTATAVYNSILMARERTKYVIIGTMIYVLLQAACIVVLGTIYGLIGLSVSTTIASTAQCLFLICIIRKNIIQ